MRRNVARWLLVVVLAGYGAHMAWLAVTANVWFSLWAVACLGGAGGVALFKPWGRYFVYLVATCTALGWLAVVASLAVNGWPYRGMSRTVMSLVPGLLLVAVCVLAIVFVRRMYKDGKAN